MSPPPLPLPPIERVRFEGNAAPFNPIAWDRARLEMAQAAAEAWLARQTGVDVVSVDSCIGRNEAFVTVWFRRRLA
jgi:hypothetical protein